MANILPNFFKQALTGDTVKDWDHASKLFVANNYKLAPKNTFLYHVYFDLNPNAAKLNGVGGQLTGPELGMLVKQVSLPKFSIDTKTLNAYNRPHVIQNKVHYDPVTIQFHDDAANVARNFWFDYFNYYYRDSDNATSTNLNPMDGTHDEISSQRQIKDWGYTIRGSQTGNLVKAPYLSAIRIYSLYNKQFSEYVLVNPIIKSFQHGEHNSSSTADTMQHSMTVEYESVLYAYGRVSSNTVKGFGDIHYDRRPTPLSAAGGGTQSLFGPGGMLASGNEIGTDLANGNILSAAFKGARVTNGLKGANLGSIALSESISLGRGMLTGNNPFGAVQFPSPGTLLSGTRGMPTGPGIGVNNLQTGGNAAGGISTAHGVGGLTRILSTTTTINSKIAELIDPARYLGSSNIEPAMPQNPSTEYVARNSDNFYSDSDSDQTRTEQ